jgi:hypothetical protein
MTHQVCLVLGFLEHWAAVTEEPNVVFVVAPGVASILEEKSAAVTVVAGLQGNPFTIIAVN